MNEERLRNGLRRPGALGCDVIQGVEGQTFQANLAKTVPGIAALPLSGFGTRPGVLGGVRYAVGCGRPLDTQQAPQQEESEGAQRLTPELHGTDCSTRR
jgi:hypothetical protein